MSLRGFFSKAAKMYKKSVKYAFNRKRLFYTNVLISTGISTLGDFLEQCYELRTKDLLAYNSKRTATMAFSGFTVGILCHHWYIILDKIIFGRTLRMVVRKLILDQCIFSPVIIITFFASVALFEDNPIENFTAEVKDKFWLLYKAEWTVWPPAQIINFYFLPTRYRVLYDNIISLGYEVYTSNIKHSKSDKSAVKEN